MTTETTTTLAPMTTEAYEALRSRLRTKAFAPTPREIPEAIKAAELPEWVEWLANNEETLEDLLERYKAFPTPQHITAGLSVGALGMSNETARLLNYWADRCEDLEDLNESPGMGRIKTIISLRRGAERALPDGMPSIEVCRSLWVADPESPTGLSSVRTGRPIKGERRAKGLPAIVYRPATGGKYCFDPADILAALDCDPEGDELSTRERIALAQAEQIKEERLSVTTITDTELQAINEIFPAHCRIAFIECRIRYNNRHSKFRTWDNEAKRVRFDVPAMLEDMRLYIGARTVERFEQLAEQGIDLAGPLCAHLRIPLTKGSLMFQDPENTAKGRI